MWGKEIVNNNVKKNIIIEQKHQKIIILQILQCPKTIRAFCSVCKKLIQDQSSEPTHWTETCYSVTCCSPPHSVHYASACVFLVSIYLHDSVMVCVCVSLFVQCVWLCVCVCWHWSPLFSCWLAVQELLQQSLLFYLLLSPSLCSLQTHTDTHAHTVQYPSSLSSLKSVSGLMGQTVALWLVSWHWYPFTDRHQEQMSLLLL